MTRHATTAALFAAVIGGFVLLGALLLPSTAGAVQARPAPAAVAPAPAAPPALITTLIPEAEVTPDRAAELMAAANRICEGVTAGVPVVVMADALVAELGLTDQEARHMVNTTAITHCPPPAATPAEAAEREALVAVSAEQMATDTAYEAATVPAPAAEPLDPEHPEYAPQLPEETDGRQIDCADGTVGEMRDGAVVCPSAEEVQ